MKHFHKKGFFFLKAGTEGNLTDGQKFLK